MQRGKTKLTSPHPACFSKYLSLSTFLGNRKATIDGGQIGYTGGVVDVAKGGEKWSKLCLDGSGGRQGLFGEAVTLTREIG